MDQHAKRFLFLLSDTGGGHRSPAQATAQTLQETYGDQVRVDLVDVLAEYAPSPFRHLGALYPYLTRGSSWPWAAVYRSTNTPSRVAFIARCCWPLVKASFLRLVSDHPADAIVCFHGLFNHMLVRTLAESGVTTPLITMVIDWATGHAAWFAPGVTRCLVPTSGVARRALACGLSAEQVVVTGLPIQDPFLQAAQQDPLTLRQQLGLDPDRPVVLLLGGAEGMGAPYHIVEAITGSGVQAQLVVIAGRNDGLKHRLAHQTWPLPVHVRGFTNSVHQWMRAADLLVTKAGPSTVGEALVMGLPMVLSGALPGQERPTVDSIVQTGAGLWAPTPQRVAQSVRELLAPGNPALSRMAAQARSLAQPDAAQRVAQVVWACANGELA